MIAYRDCLLRSLWQRRTDQAAQCTRRGLVPQIAALKYYRTRTNMDKLAHALGPKTSLDMENIDKLGDLGYT